MFRLTTAVLILALFCLFLAGFLHPITAYTQDLGRHLLLGEMIWKTFQVPNTNLLSYTYPDFPFLNHHYLSEVIYYLLKQVFGDNGLLFFSLGLVLSASGLVFYEALKKSSIIPVTIISILSLRILFERTDIRPEQFGYLFLSLFIIIFYRFRETNTRLIFLIPFLSFLWIQLHISFAIGLLVIGLFLIDASITSYRIKSWNKTKQIIIVFIISCLACLVNPNGLAGFLYPLHIFDNYGYTIQENQTIFLLDQIAPSASILYFKIAVLLLFTSLFLTYKKTKPIDWILSIIFTFLAANAIRNFPLFVFATFIPFSYSLGIIYEKLIKQIKNPQRITFIILSFLLLVICWQISIVTKTKAIGVGTARGAEKGVNFFIDNKLRGPIFNNFDIGSYLAYRLYPQEKVFIDGRPEAYPASFLQQIYIPMQQDQKMFTTQDSRYHFNAIFFSHTDQTPWANQFLKDILSNPVWKIVYLDDTVLILLKDNPQNQSFIKKFAMVKDNLRISHLDEKNFNSLLHLASFLNKTGLLSQEAPIDEKILQLNPTYCPALYDLTIFHSQQNRQIQAAAYQQQFLSHCQ